MEYPSEEKIRSMTNREIASLIHFQSARIDQTHTEDDRLGDDVGPPNLWLSGVSPDSLL